VNARAYKEKVWGFDSVVQGHSLARVNKHKYFFVHALKVHLFVNFLKVLRLQNLCVLNFEKVLATMSIEVYEYFRLGVGLQLLGLREIWGVSASKQVQNCFVSKIFSLVVNLNIIAVEVFSMVCLCP
jgi:hypothetical protein